MLPAAAGRGAVDGARVARARERRPRARYRPAAVGHAAAAALGRRPRGAETIERAAAANRDAGKAKGPGGPSCRTLPEPLPPPAMVQGRAAKAAIDRAEPLGRARRRGTCRACRERPRSPRTPAIRSRRSSSRRRRRPAAAGRGPGAGLHYAVCQWPGDEPFQSGPPPSRHRLAGALGSPVLATTTRQTVVFAGRPRRLRQCRDHARRVRLPHLYGHLKTITARVGQVLDQGDKLGHLGSTGRSTGPHVHYEVRDGKAGTSIRSRCSSPRGAPTRGSPGATCACRCARPRLRPLTLGRDRARRPDPAPTIRPAPCRSARTRRSGCRRADTNSRRCAASSARAASTTRLPIVSVQSSWKAP